MLQKVIIGLVGTLGTVIAIWLGVVFWQSTHKSADTSAQAGVSADIVDRPAASSASPSANPSAPPERPAQRLADLPPDQQLEPDELLVSDPPRGFATTAEAMGFTVVETVSLGQLNMVIMRLRIPRDSTVPEARQTLASRFPGVAIDAHQIYQTQSLKEYQTQTARPIAGWPPSNEACGAGVRMGQIDSPVDTSHPALSGQRVQFRSFHTPNRQAGPADHGTAIAAMLVGKPDWGGLLPGAELVAANMFEINESGDIVGSGLGLLKAIDWMVEKQVQVVNLSVAGGDNQIVRKAFEKAREKGLILVAAAGNWGAAARPAYPAAYRDVIAVTAIDRTRNSYSKANHGPYIDFAAPGVQVYTAVPRGGRIMSGTSFATPYITVLLAVQVEAGAPRSPTALRDLLGPRAVDLGKPGKDEVFGWGLVNLWPRCP